ncbi:glycosyltransferase [Glutamicibacter sp. JC586]|uniref:glycosyltransferase n=1 Tax=Glutamicibacter sp. JC586 TaxID=2590552 RepID=UPI00135B3E8B|nr:glycosyltransferase [Glutamicibacter sp. JC586]
MKILSIIPDIGAGGLTGAVLNRMSLLSREGNDCSVVFYQFIPGLNSKVSGLRETGKLGGSVQVFNPYTYFDELHSSKLGYKVESLQFIHRHEVQNSKEIIESHLDETLTIRARIFKSTDARQITKIQFFTDSGSLWKEEIYYGREMPHVVRFHENGNVVREKYLSQNGYCYLSQEFDPKDGNLSGLWVSGSGGRVKFHKSIWDWRRDFVKHVVCANSSENSLLCDGNNVPRQFLRMRSDRFKVYAVLHMNHVGLNGKLRKQYAGYFGRLSEFDGVVCLTEAQAEDLREEFGLLNSLHVIPNRVASLVDDQTVVDDGVHDVTLISRLEAGKGVEDAVDAFRLVVDRLPRAQMSIYGSGTKRDEIRKSIIRNGLQGNVTLCGATKRPLLEMSQSKVFVFTSESEGFGMTIVEAMSCGTPVVAFDCKYGPASIIADGLTGFIVKDRNGSGFADRVIQLLENDILRSNFAHSSKQRFENQFSDGIILKKWKNVLGLKWN